MLSLTSSLSQVAAFAASVVALHAGPPPGWNFAGKAQEYDCNVDAASVYLKAKEGVKPTAFASVSQDFNAAPYAGKRVRLTANLKSENVQQWGGLWMRVDDANRPHNGYSSSVAFDDMQDRPIKGTTAWRNYSVVLDVPPGATGIYIGFLLAGPGTLWMTASKVEIVGADVPVTGKPIPPPVLNPYPHLTFEKRNPQQ
jgi:hypothetical protein